MKEKNLIIQVDRKKKKIENELFKIAQEKI